MNINIIHFTIYKKIEIDLTLFPRIEIDNGMCTLNNKTTITLKSKPIK